MITWLLLTVVHPIDTINFFICLWCGISIDAIIIEKILQKMIDKQSKNR